jgi:hypothetical protein
MKTTRTSITVWLYSYSLGRRVSTVTHAPTTFVRPRTVYIKDPMLPPERNGSSNGLARPASASRIPGACIKTTVSGETNATPGPTHLKIRSLRRGAEIFDLASSGSIDSPRSKAGPFYLEIYRPENSAELRVLICSQLRSGPGRDRTCDLGIKSPGGMVAACGG